MQATTRQSTHEMAERVEKILVAMAKLIHGKKLYSENNPRLAEFARALEQAVEQFFKFNDVLVLTVDKSELLWEGHVVYSNEKREESIAFVLYKDGVGELSIDRQALGPELNLLLRILSDEYHNRSMHEDVVTKFWNADFEHISYRVIDDYLNVDVGGEMFDQEPETPPSDDHEELTPTLKDKGRIIIQKQDPLEPIANYLQTIASGDGRLNSADDAEVQFQQMMESLFGVSQDEVDTLHRELESERADDQLVAFFENLFVFLSMGENQTAIRDVAGVLLRIGEYVVDEARPKSLGRCLRLVDDYGKRDGLLPEAQDAVTKLTNSFRNPGLVQTLGDRISGWNDETEEILDYLAAIGEPATDSLLRVIHNESGTRLHKAVCDTCCDIHSDDISRVVDQLDIDQPHVAADAVYMLNRAGVTELSPRIQELLYFPDTQLKEQMVELLARSENPVAIEMLISVLPDDDRFIREKALAALASRAEPRVRDHLTELALGADRGEVPFEDSEPVFKALGRVGDTSTVSALRQLVSKRSIMQRARSRENKLLAIRALENICNPESINLLEQLSQDSHDAVRERAQRGLNNLRRRMSAKEEA